MFRTIPLVLTAMCMYAAGAAVAKTIFDESSPTVVVWLRLLLGAVLLLAITCPRLRGRTRQDWLIVVGFGVSLAAMNWSYYEAIDRIPLGLAVLFESIGPLTVAVVMSRHRSDLLWVALGAVGIVLLSVEPGSLTWAGVIFALVAGAGWGAYILLSQKTGQHWEGVDGLAVASSVAALLVTPVVLTTGAHGLGSAHVWWVGVIVSLLSSVIPYSLELVALRRVPAHVFGVLMSIEPGIAALIGFLGLGQHLGWLAVLALVLVIAASIGVTRSAQPARPMPELLP